MPGVGGHRASYFRCSGRPWTNSGPFFPTFAQTIQYDAFGNMTARSNSVWGDEHGFTASYVNGRKQNSDEVYDAAGNIVDKTLSSTIYDRWTFDASARPARTK